MDQQAYSPEPMNVPGSATGYGSGVTMYETFAALHSRSEPVTSPINSDPWIAPLPVEREASVASPLSTVTSEATQNFRVDTIPTSTFQKAQPWVPRTGQCLQWMFQYQMVMGMKEMNTWSQTLQQKVKERKKI
eukprot:6456672-Amphidinium_carterae.2